MDLLSLLLFPLLGFFSGAVGALIGAGGGFILVPILLTIMPDESPGIITGISQTMVLMTSLSGSVAYARQRRIEYRWAALLAVSGLAGMALGAIINENLSREGFQAVFGVVALIVVAYLMVRPLRGRGAARSLLEARTNRVPLSARHVAPVALLGLATAIMGGLLGLGGGIALVPILVQVFVFPAHLATATSQLVIFLTSPAAIAVHVVAVDLHEQVLTIVLLGAGAIAGAQAGARLSRRFSAPWLVRTLAIALGIIGVRLIATSGLI